MHINLYTILREISFYRGASMPKYKILIIEDDENIQELISFNFRNEGWDIECCTDGTGGLQSALSSPPDLLLLDLMLPGMDGLQVCRKFKDKFPNIPVVMLTAKGEEADIILGLEMGADDYVTKPFSPRILIARIRAVLRRNTLDTANEENIIKRGVMQIDLTKQKVKIKNKRIDLTATEFKLLQFLSARPGWVFTRNQIIDSVRGEDAIVTDRAVDVQVVGLRKKLGIAGNMIETVRGVGYRFGEEEQ